MNRQISFPERPEDSDAMMTGYDNIILHAGNFGKYQRRLFLILLLPPIACAFHQMGGVFLAARVDFRCLLPDENPENTTYQLPLIISNLSEEIKIWPRPRCERYDPDSVQDDRRASGTNISSTSPNLKCNSFVFDKTHYAETVTTEWDLVCDNAWLKSLSESLLMLCDIPGSMIFGELSDRYGRKAALLWGSILQLIFATLVALSPSFNAYLVFRVLVATTGTSLLTVVFVTALEIVSPKNRTISGVMVNLAFTVGYILCAGLAYSVRSWRYLQIAFAIPTIGLLTFWWYIPESACWLLSKGRVEEAKAVIQKICSENGVRLSSETLDGLLNIDAESKPAAVEKTSLFDMLRSANLWKKSLLLSFIWLVIGATYMGLSWSTSDLGGNDYVNFVIAATVEVPAFITQIFTSGRWGTKITLCGGMLLSGAFCLLTYLVPTGTTWLVILSAMMGKFAISLSLGAANIFTVEQYPTAHRNIGLAACMGFAKIGGGLSPYINNLSEVSTSLPLVVFGSSSLVAGLSTVLLPETSSTDSPETRQDAEQPETITSIGRTGQQTNF